MNRKPLIKKANKRKINLIKKYAKIRFHRFWKEWGITKEELEMFLGALLIFIISFGLYIVGCIF